MLSVISRSSPAASPANGSTLAQNVATVVESQTSVDDSVVVNNGPTATVTSGTNATSGTASNADLCYCPSGGASSVTWGSAVSCGSACPGTNTGYAGKFVSVSATKHYTPLFSNYAIVHSGAITASAVVQVK